MAPELPRIFFPLFQAGVTFEIEQGCSIEQLLTNQFGIMSDYIASRITTIFLNSKAVDKAGIALIHDGAVLALSGAMPGLVGATMRSGGYYAAMRGAMTYRNEEGVKVGKRGVITIKLFNLLLEELGPRLLLHGFIIPAPRWREFLAQQPERLRVKGYRVDGRQVPADRFLRCEDFSDDGEMLKVKVHIGEDLP
ncbi:MAG: hypothetical protein ACYC9I_12270 [Desulfuromonadales bacterium]